MSRPAAVPVGPVLLSAPLRQLPLIAGRWLRRAYLKPMPFADYPDLAGAGIVSGIYLVTDHLKHVRWLGQASREDDLVARLGAHHADPAKAGAFVTLRVLHLLDLTPPDAINAIEGRCADVLGLRGTMGIRRWPCADNWLERVSLRARIRRLAPSHADSVVLAERRGEADVGRRPVLLRAAPGDGRLRRSRRRRQARIHPAQAHHPAP